MRPLCILGLVVGGGSLAGSAHAAETVTEPVAQADATTPTTTTIPAHIELSDHRATFGPTAVEIRSSPLEPTAPRSLAPAPRNDRIGPTHVVFYGWENIVVGELGVGLTALGWAAGSAKLAVPGIMTYVIGGPVVHALNGSEKKAWGSLAIETGIPLTGAGLGALIANRMHENPTYWAVVGTTIGIVSAPVIDGLCLGWARKANDSTPKRVAALPTFDIGTSPDGRATMFAVGARGTF
jgi:hypothetical protein